MIGVYETSYIHDKRKKPVYTSVQVYDWFCIILKCSFWIAC